MFKKLGEETDSLGRKLEIIYSDHIAFTPVYTLILKTHIELVEKKISAPMLGERLNDHTHVIWANYEDIALGGIAFSLRPTLFCSFIELSFTDPAYRQQGINKICHKYFENFTKEQDLIGICSYVAIENEARIKAAAGSNFFPSGYMMWKKV